MSGHWVVNNVDTHFYTASKYAVTALTEGLRQELQEAKIHIRATVRAGGSRSASDKHFIYEIWLRHVLLQDLAQSVGSFFLWQYISPGLLETEFAGSLGKTKKRLLLLIKV